MNVMKVVTLIFLQSAKAVSILSAKSIVMYLHINHLSLMMMNLPH